MTFTEGLQVIYKGHIGFIQVVTPEYVTFCIREFPNEPSRDVCLLIYNYDFSKVKLIKESDK